MKKIALTLLLLLLGTTPGAAKTDICNAPLTVAKVDGMVCDFCVQSIKKVLEKEEPVKAVDIDLTAKEVRITLKPGATLSDDIVRQKIDWAGYKLTGIEHSCGGPETGPAAQ